MIIHVDPSSSVPVFQQIVDEVKSAIARGACAPGEMIPSVRVLAAQSLVNPNTVARAYRDLEQQGIVVSRRGIGLVVAEAAQGLSQRERRESLQKKLADLAAEAQRAGVGAGELRQAFDAALKGMGNAESRATNEKRKP